MAELNRKKQHKIDDGLPSIRIVQVTTAASLDSAMPRSLEIVCVSFGV